MKIAVIDNNEIYSDLLSKIIEGHSFEPFKVNLHSKIEKILDDLRTEKPSLVFINVEAYLDISNSPASQPGVDILKHIRLTEDLDKQIRRVPIILYSFAKEKEELIRLRPENLIVFSEGCYYLNIFNLNRSIVEDLINVTNDFLIGQGIEIKPLSDLNSLRPYVKADTRDIIIEDRHSIANWWGPHRLLKGYILATDPASESSYKNHPVMKTLEEEKKKLSVKKLIFIKKEGQALTYEKRESIQAMYGHDRVRLTALLTKKQVLYVDDEADTGWADSLRKVLFPNTKLALSESNGRYVFCDSVGNEHMIFFKSFQKAEEEISRLADISIVFLDLRDKKKDFNIQQPDKLTGIQLLKKIKDQIGGDPSVPVVIFTASNKQWNYETVLAIGADGYWIKESPEFGIDDEYSLTNYLKLFNDTKYLLSREYLRKIWRCVRESNTAITMDSNISEQDKKIISHLLRSAFYSLQYGDRISFAQERPLHSVLILLGLSWEKLRRCTSKLIDVKDANIVDHFLYHVRGNYLHAGQAVSLLTISDIGNFFAWFTNLINQSYDYKLTKVNNLYELVDTTGNV